LKNADCELSAAAFSTSLMFEMVSNFCEVVVIFLLQFRRRCPYNARGRWRSDRGDLVNRHWKHAHKRYSSSAYCCWLEPHTL